MRMILRSKCGCQEFAIIHMHKGEGVGVVKTENPARICLGRSEGRHKPSQVMEIDREQQS